MSEKRKVPASLKIVAGIFLVLGVYGAVETLYYFITLYLSVSLVSLTRSAGWRILRLGHEVNLLGLGLFIGCGLLRYKKAWRTIAVIFLLAEMAAMVFLIGYGAKHRSSFLDYCSYVGLFAVALWQYTVLSRPNVRAVFTEGPPRRWAPPVGWRPPEPHEAYSNAVAIMAKPDIRGSKIEEVWHVKDGVTVLLRDSSKKPARIIFHGVLDMRGDETDGMVVKSLYEMPDAPYRKFRFVADGESEAYLEVRALGFTAIVDCPEYLSDQALNDPAALPYDVYRA